MDLDKIRAMDEEEELGRWEAEEVGAGGNRGGGGVGGGRGSGRGGSMSGNRECSNRRSWGKGWKYFLGK